MSDQNITTMDSIRSLSDEELITKLKDFGEQVGPMTASTRGIFERRLLKYVCPPEGENETLVASTDSTGTPSRVKAILAEEVLSMEPAVYYGVQLPAEVKHMETICVFTDKSEALKLTKKYPGSRFKPFGTRPDAVKFAKLSPETFVPQSPSVHAGAPGPVVARQPVSDGSSFRSVKTPDLIKLRKLIETGNVALARDLIWSNPRYLINSGDTPTILQEGFRYNALHVAAMKNQPQSAQLILDILEDAAFMHLLYPTEPPESRDNRIQFLVDLYLNTPDKGNCECALHFACKFGHVEVVDVLASHPKLDKNRKNKYGETPSDLMCTRAKHQSAAMMERIQELLQDRYYVPLWRSEDNSCSPHVASPWSPTVEGEAPWKSPASLGSPSSCNGSNPSGSPRDSPISVKAYAGPMTSKQAQRFRKNWLTPPSASPRERKQMADIRRRDPEKGLERIGRTVAQDMQVSWCEYWDFLDSYIDLASDEGLNKLEDHLQIHYDAQQRNQELENDLERVASRLDKLHLCSPEHSAKNLAKRLGFGDTLVLYLDKTTVENTEDSQNTCNGVKHQNNVDPGNVFFRTNINNDEDSLDKKNSNRTSEPDGIFPSNGIIHSEHSEEHKNLLSKETSMPNSSSVGSDSLSQTNLGNSESHDDSLTMVDPWDLSSRLESFSYIDDSDSDASSITSYHTALDADESDAESLFTPPQSLTPEEQIVQQACFINGDEPSKLDIEVLQAIEHVKLDSDRFPRIGKWKSLIKGFTADQYKRWGSPRQLKKTRPSVLITTPSSSVIHSPLRPYLTPTRGLSRGTPAGLTNSASSQRVVFRSPSFSPSSPSSESDSDSSFNSSVVSVRTNLMSSFLSDKC